jgi:hypothetical protein
LSILVSLIVIQWPSAPRGASVKPTPLAPSGQVDGSHLSTLAVDRSPALMVGDQLVLEIAHLQVGAVGVQAARGGAAQGGEQRRDRHVELLQHGIDRVLELWDCLGCT